MCCHCAHCASVSQTVSQTKGHWNDVSLMIESYCKADGMVIDIKMIECQIVFPIAASHERNHVLLESKSVELLLQKSPDLLWHENTKTTDNDEKQNVPHKTLMTVTAEFARYVLTSSQLLIHIGYPSHTLFSVGEREQ